MDMNQFNQGISLDSRNKGGFASLAPQGYFDMPLAKQFETDRSPQGGLMEQTQFDESVYPPIRLPNMYLRKR